MKYSASSLYIHIPFCISKCDYCDFFSVPCGCKKGALSDRRNASSGRISRVESWANCGRNVDVESRGDYAGRISRDESRTEGDRISDVESRTEGDRISDVESRGEAEQISSIESQVGAERISDAESRGGAKRISRVESWANCGRNVDVESRGDYAGRISRDESRTEGGRISDIKLLDDYAERISRDESRTEGDRISEVESRGEAERISGVESRAKNIIPDEYVFALCNEIKFCTRQFDVKKWETVYIGGGTPSLLSEKQIKMISAEVFSLSKDIKEFTIEVNPCDVTKKALLCYEKCGITRLSLGVQSLNDEVLRFSKRRSSLGDVKNALNAIKNDWKHDFSCDIISSLPYQTEKSFLSELETLVSYKPNHISLYSLTIESETPLGKAVESGKLHYDFDKASDVWLKGRDFLLENGYEQYEVSNFFNKKNGSPCLHNLNYWQLKNYIGCGSGAVGSIYDKNVRYENTKNIAEYVKFWEIDKIWALNKPLATSEAWWGRRNAHSEHIANVKLQANGERISKIESRAETERFFDIVSRSGVENVEQLDKKTEMFEYFMMNLRIFNGFGITDDDFFKRFALHIPENVIALFEEWQKNGDANIWTENDQKHYSLNEKGILFLNRFLEGI